MAASRTLLHQPLSLKGNQWRLTTAGLEFLNEVKPTVKYIQGSEERSKFKRAGI